MQKHTPLISNVILSISLFCILTSIFSLTYSGTYTTDDEHILASRTLSMAYDNQINDDRVLGNSRVFSYSNLAPIYASQGLNIEPLQAFLGSFLAKIALSFKFGHVQAIYILNIILTSLTAVVIFWTLSLLGFSKLTSFSLGIIFGICTIAWPYSRTYFRDPVAMFFLTLAWSAFLLIKSERYHNQRNNKIPLLLWLLGFFGLCLGILSKNTVLFAIPVIIISLLIKPIKRLKMAQIKSILIANWQKFLFVFFLLLSAFLFWVTSMPTTGIYSRFTFAYYLAVIKNIFGNPHPQVVQALFGPIISPGKSIFLYSPILILPAISLQKFFRHAWSAWLFFIVSVAGQAFFYGADWWGHVNWGLRYLLPTVPLLIIASAPIFELLLTTKLGQLSLLFLGSISLFVQLIGVLAPVRQYYVALTETTSPVSFTSSIWNPKYSALWWHIKWILSGGLSDLALSRIGLESIPVIIIIIILIFFSIIFIGGKFKLCYSITIFFATLLSLGFILSIVRNDPSNLPRSDLAISQDVIHENHLPEDIILIKSYGTQAWSYWMNWADPELKWISLPFIFPEQHFFERYQISKDLSVGLDQISIRLIQKAEKEYLRVWLVIPEDSPGSNFNWEALYLAEEKHITNYWFFSANGNITRLYLFEQGNKID